MKDFFPGHFLLAQTDLKDPNFFRSVVLLTEHNAEGAFGLVLNRRSETVLGEVLAEVGGTAAAAIPLYAGGPVGREYIFVLHGGYEFQSTERQPKTIAPGLVFEPLTDTFVGFLKGPYAELDARQRHPINMYVGYAGWGPGQLEDEYRRESWYSCPAVTELVFTAEADSMWEECMKRLGPLHAIIARTGYKPSMN